MGGLGGYSSAPIIFDLGVGFRERQRSTERSRRSPNGTWTPQVKSGYSMYSLFTISVSYPRMFDIDLRQPC
jgi:hypothetical protein